MKTLLTYYIGLNGGTFQLHTWALIHSYFLGTYTFIFSFLRFPWICSWMSCYVAGFVVCKTWSGQGVYYPACIKNNNNKKNNNIPPPKKKPSDSRINNGGFKGSRTVKEVTQFGGEGTLLNAPQSVERFAWPLLECVLTIVCQSPRQDLFTFSCKLFLYFFVFLLKKI